MSLPSHSSDGIAEVAWSWHDVIVESCRRWYYRDDLAMVRCRCQVMLAMVLPKRLGWGAMSLMSHAGNGVAEVTWP
jgi:hypothetical protein